MYRYLSFWIYFFVILMAISCSDPDNGSEPDPAPEGNQGNVEAWITSGNESYLFSKQTLDFSQEIGNFTIVIDSVATYQLMDGFGAALTGSSAYLINRLSEENRNKLLTDLFDPDEGIGINYLRITIGSSDFSIGTYSYCDAGNIAGFDIPQQDRTDLLPVLKAILKINPTIKILASPWSAPAWMKQNKHMYGGSLMKEKSIYNDFAEYFVSYVKAFEKEGITIDAITIQNEPMHEINTYPTMKMEWEEQNLIIRDYLGPKFRDNNIKTKIIIWDHNFDMDYYPMNILNDPITNRFVSGTGWHGYGGNASSIDKVQAVHPDKDVYFTEQSGGGWNTDLDTYRMGTMFYYMENFLMATVNRGSKNFIMWNLALDSNNGPTTTTGGCQDCRGVVTIRDNGSYYRNLEYYLIGHFSKAVRLNAKRIKNTTNKMPSGIVVSSFLNEDGSKAIIVMNRSGENQSYTIRCANRRINYNHPNDAVVTFKFK